MKMRTAFYLFTAFSFLLAGKVNGQANFRVDPDSVRVINGEFILQNPTSNIRGVLINTGNGLTNFQKLQLANLGDSAIAITRQDTLSMRNFSGINTAGFYYVLSKNIALYPGYYYHPLAFESPLDSGVMYHVHALIYQETNFAFDGSSLFRISFSDSVYSESPQLRNTTDAGNGLKKYSLEYDKVIRSTRPNDTLRLSFYTRMGDTSGSMKLDSLSYMHVERFTPLKYSD